MKKMSKYPIDGKYGKYGGRFVPEVLMAAIIELEEAYNSFKNNSKFITELEYYLSDYAGRPTSLYFAENLTKKIGGALFCRKFNKENWWSQNLFEKRRFGPWRCSQN